MQNIKQAIQLNQKAQNYQTQGNYQYAIRCYQKIIILFKAAIGEATSDKTIKQIQSKYQKYLMKLNKAKQKQNQKNKKINVQRIQKFGFPVKPAQLQFKKIQENNKQNIGLSMLRQQVQNQKKVTQYKKKPNNNIKIDPSIDDLIIKKLDITFDDVVGMKQAKQLLQQAVIRPRLRPDLYTGIRAPPRGVLLYGPPGNGKTYICKALAKQSNCTFIALSASSILNKFVGQSQKMLKKIFMYAEELAPTIIFIDQIDSMLTARSQNQNQASRRLKTQFLVLMDGISSPKSGQIFLIGATNLPSQIDAAAKRRFSKLIYIGHPTLSDRKQMLCKKLKQVQNIIQSSEMNKIAQKLEGYSASQIHNIIAQVSMIPLRQLQKGQFQRISKAQLRKISYKDFKKVLQNRKPIVSKQQLQKYKGNK